MTKFDFMAPKPKTLKEKLICPICHGFIPSPQHIDVRIVHSYIKPTQVTGVCLIGHPIGIQSWYQKETPACAEA